MCAWNLGYTEWIVTDFPTPVFQEITVLSGGIVSKTGGINMPGVVTMAASEAVGDGVTDDTVALNSFLASLSPGLQVIIPQGTFYLINSNDLVVPTGITIDGGGNPLSLWGSPNGAFAGNGFYLNPAYSIVCAQSSGLRRLKIYRKGLLANPATADVQNAVTQWGNDCTVLYTNGTTPGGGTTLNFASTNGVSIGQKVWGSQIQAGTIVVSVAATSVGISVPTRSLAINSGQLVRFGASAGVVLLNNGTYTGPVTLAGPSNYVNLEDLVIIGFNAGVLAGCGAWLAENVQIDSYYGLLSVDAGDNLYARRMRCGPFYGINNGITALVRPGIGFYLGENSTGHNFEQCFVFGWKNGYILNNTSDCSMTGCGGEDPNRQSGGIGVLFQNNTYCTWMSGEIGGYAVAQFDIQNPSGGTFPDVKILAPNVLGTGSLTSIHFRMGSNTEGDIISPRLTSIGSGLAFVAQANVVGPWRIISPGLPNGSPAAWATIDPTSVAAVNWVLPSPNGGGAFQLSPNTGDQYGGNPRGSESVDLQLTRTAATQICQAPQAGLLSGADNTLMNTATWSVVAGGKSHTLSAQCQFTAGFQNILTGNYSAALIGNATDRGRVGALTIGNANAAGAGFQQMPITTLGATTTDATPTQLTADQQSAGSANVLNLGNGQAVCLSIRVVAQGSGGTATWTADGLLLIGGAAPVNTMLVGGGTLSPAQTHGTTSGWSVAVSADTTNGGLNITATGAASNTIHWCAVVIGAETE